jgi:bile acid:Na+ symporter, BASS family
MDNSATIALAISLFIIMIGMGLSLTIDDFRRILKYPLAVFVGFLNQIILLPLLAYLLIVLLGVEAEIAIGLMILSACPGGPTSNLLTHLAKGDTALSVSLTAVNSLVTIISIPLIVNFALAEFATDDMFITAPVGKIMGSLIAIIAVPLTIGMLLKHYKSSFAYKMDKPVRIASGLVLLLVIVGLVLKEKDNLIPYLERSWVVVLSLNVLTMLVGFASAKIFKLNFKQALSISIESGNQNGTLAIAIAVSLLARPDFAIAAAIYSLLMFITAIVPVYIGNKMID